MGTEFVCLEYLLGFRVYGVLQSENSVQVDIQVSLVVLNDEEATVASNEANKASLPSQ